MTDQVCQPTLLQSGFDRLPRFDLTGWPTVDLERVRKAFREVPLEAYPELTSYGRAGVHDGLQGQGGLFLASDMAKRLSLRPGMQVLDLGCGVGTTSIFLAKTKEVVVFAVDEEIPNDLSERARREGVGGRVIPVRADCRRLPFAHGQFDAVFSMNAFFYFGTDDLYPSYLVEFLKQAGEVVIGSPCYREELDDSVSKELLLEFPDCLAVHSPAWWFNHFAKSRVMDVLESALHPRGVEFWEDRVRFLLENQPVESMSPGRRAMVLGILRMLNADDSGFVSHFIFHGRKRSGGRDAIPPQRPI